MKYRPCMKTFEILIDCTFFILHCSGKPVILLSGDDDGRAYMFEPNSQNPDDWSYRKVTFCDAGTGTVGELSAADVDADGYVEVFVPSYSKNEVLVYSFKPEPALATAIVG